VGREEEGRAGMRREGEEKEREGEGRRSGLPPPHTDNFFYATEKHQRNFQDIGINLHTASTFHDVKF